MNNQGLKIVAVGASAGGLEALQSFLGNLTGATDRLAIIVAQHLSPSYKSMLVQLLARSAHGHVLEARNGQTLEGGYIYITPPDRNITVAKQKIFLTAAEGVAAGPRPSINSLLQSLAEDQGQAATGVILSGTGTDGSEGARHIKEKSGLVLVQDPAHAKYDGMPNATIDHSEVDQVAGAAQLGRMLPEMLFPPPGHNPAEEAQDDHLEQNPVLAKVFRLLEERTGTDFSNYKASTISRRIQKRLDMLGMESLEAYLDHLNTSPDEADKLSDTILIGVTAFFRDKEAFRALERHMRQLLDNKTQGDPIRIWIPGCATGEEAYSITIMLAEILQKRLASYQLQIFASDIDEQALATARRGLYSPEKLEGVPESIVETYFLKKGENYELVRHIRQLVLFSKHDLTSNPPFLKLDLISCRNLLIYFNLSLQKHVLPILHYALRGDGLLFLGKSESIGQFSNLFHVEDGRYKIFSKETATEPYNVKFKFVNPSGQAAEEGAAKSRPNREKSLAEVTKDTLYNAFPHPFAVVNEDYQVQTIKGDVRLYLGIQEGSPSNNLVQMASQELQIELRALLNRVRNEQSFVRSAPTHIHFMGQSHWVVLNALPLINYSQASNLFLVYFEPSPQPSITQSRQTTEEDEANPRVVELEQELAATKEQLQTFIEELETANEELQSVNEELQASNEELQASNEELQSSNEELQASNEELQVAYSELAKVNENLEQKEEALRHTQANQEALLNNTLQAFVLLDDRFTVLEFNELAAQSHPVIFSRPLERDRSIIDFLEEEASSFFITKLKETVQKAEALSFQWHLGDGEQAAIYRCELTPISDEDGRVTRISFAALDATESTRLRENLQEREQMISGFFQSADIGLCVIDSQGLIVQTNRGLRELVHYEEAELQGRSFVEFLLPEQQAAAHAAFEAFMVEGQSPPEEWKLVAKNGDLVDIFATVGLHYQPDGTPYAIITTRDITKSQLYKNLLEHTEAAAKIGGWDLDLNSGLNTWTEEIYRIYEVAPEDFEVSEENGLQFYPPKAQETLKVALAKARENGECFDLELPFTSAKGIEKWVRATCTPLLSGNRPVRLRGTFQDITEKKKREEQLSKLSLVASKTSNGVVITDTQGLTEWTNEGFYQITGYTLEELQGKKPGHVLQGPDTAPETVSEIRQLLQGNEPFTRELLNYHKSGTPYWVRMSITPIFGEDGQLSRHIAIESDITDRKEREQVIEEALREKEMLINEIHHRVKNNLAIVSGLLKLQAVNFQDQAVHKAFRESQDRIYGMSLIHEQLYSNEQFSEIDFQHYLNSLAKHLTQSYQTNGNFQVVNHTPSGMQLDIVRAIPCGLIVNELVTNSIKHAFTDQETGKVEVGLQERGDSYKLEIADNGQGLGEDFQLGQAKSLGLNLVNQLSRQIRAEIDIQSSEEGSRFSFTFPKNLNK